MRAKVGAILCTIRSRINIRPISNLIESLLQSNKGNDRTPHAGHVPRNFCQLALAGNPKENRLIALSCYRGFPRD